MARTAKPGMTNGYNAKILKSYVERIEHSKGEIASIMGKAMADCKTHHEDMAVTLQEAKDEHGILKKALRAVVTLREFERKKEAALDKLSDEDREGFDQMAHALGDFAATPLGQAALSTAKH